MSKTSPAKFIREVRAEAGKVVWPTRKETLTATAMILALVVVSAVFFLLVDNLASAGIQMILGIGK